MRPRSLELSWHSRSYPKGQEIRADIIDAEGFHVLDKLDPVLARHLSFCHNVNLLDNLRWRRHLDERDQEQAGHDRAMEELDRR